MDEGAQHKVATARERMASCFFIVRYQLLARRRVARRAKKYPKIFPKTQKDTAQAVSFGKNAARRKRLLRGLFFDVFHHVADRLQLLRIFVGDFDRKLLLESHDELDRVERISAEIFDKRCSLCDLLRIHA